MSKFPETLKGEALEKLYRSAADVIPENKITYYKKMMESIAHFYGVISIKRVYELFTDSYNEELTEDSFLKLCEFLRYEQQGHFNICSEDEYYETDTDEITAPMDRLIVYEPYVYFEDSYEAIKKLKEGKPWYIPPKEVLENNTDHWIAGSDEAYEAFIKFMSEEFGFDRADAEYKTDDAVFSISRENRTFDDFLDNLQHMKIDPDLEQVKKLAPHYKEMNNSMRMAANNGYTPAEMKRICDETGLVCDTMFIDEVEIDEEHEQKRFENAKYKREILRSMSNKLSSFMKDKSNKKSNNSGTVVKSKKIGRNEPCPCGSGKKYKKCCGR